MKSPMISHQTYGTISSGPFTINAKDYHGLKGCGRDFVPENQKDHLIQGLIGAYKGKSIYVSKSIPVGFFYEGERIPELHWHPQGGNHYIEIEPDLPAEIELRVWNTLYPFKLFTPGNPNNCPVRWDKLGIR